MKPAAFIFDIGNVLLRFDYGRAWERLQAQGAVMPEFAALEALSKEYESGAVDRPEFLRRLATMFGNRIPEGELALAWQDIFEPNAPMWETVAGLSRDYPLYLLSNTNCLQHDYFIDRYDVFRFFRDGVFSYREKMMKPESGIFSLAVERFGVRPEATIYLDDLESNVAAARDAGLCAFQYHPDCHGDCLDWLRAQGVQCV